MYKNKNQDGSLIICGNNIKALRQELTPAVSHRMMSDKLQLVGIYLDKNAIQKIERGKSFVTDIGTVAFAKVFNISTDELLKKDLREIIS